MKTIYKYPIRVKDVQVIEMPVGARILALQVQGSQPCLWAEIDMTVPREKEVRTFETWGTGQPMDSAPRQYVGTYQMSDGEFIWHVYECK